MSYLFTLVLVIALAVLVRQFVLREVQKVHDRITCAEEAAVEHRRRMMERYSGKGRDLLRERLRIRLDKLSGDHHN